MQPAQLCLKSESTLILLDLKKDLSIALLHAQIHHPWLNRFPIISQLKQLLTPFMNLA